MNRFTSITTATSQSFAYGRIVSLTDMLDIYAASYFAHGHALSRIAAECDLRRRDEMVLVSSNQTLMGCCRQFQEACKGLHLDYTLVALERFLTQPPEALLGAVLVDTLGEIRRRAYDELRNRKFLYMESAKTQLYEAEYPLGKEVETRLPEASADISEAAKCLALDRYTAAVFHFSRVLEHALNVFYKHVVGNAPMPNDTWGQKLKPIPDKIKAMPKSTESEKATQRSRFVVYEAFDSIKEAWRNPSVHDLGKVYTDTDAKELMARTKQVCTTLIALLGA